MENITKAEALKKIDELRKFVTNLDSKETKEVEMEKLFLELVNQGLTLKIDSNVEEIHYYNEDNDLIISIELKNKKVWFDYDQFWSKFKSKFDLNYQQIKEFLNGMVGKHLNCNGFTTILVWLNFY